jgi:HEAT repeat protein
MFLFMRNRIFWSFGLLVGLAGALWADPKPKPKESYIVRPSSQTVKRRESALSLGQSKDASAGPALLQALEDRDSMTRALAVRSLGKLKYVPARSKLSALLATDPSDQVREASALALRQIGDPKAVTALLKALSDTSTNVRVTALAGLAQYKDTKARPGIEAACHDKAVQVRRTAVYVLGRLEDPKAIPVVLGLTKDLDASVRAGAAQSLGALHAEDSKDALRDLLKDPDNAVQASAAHSLAMLGDSTGFEKAKELVQDPNLAVRILAIDTLGWSEDPSAESALQTLLTEAPADTRPAVQEALMRNQQLRKKP